MKQVSFALALLVLCFTTAFAGELAVKVTVSEPAGAARKSGPASGGVPFKKGQVKNVKDLALFDKSGKPVPAQFSLLAPYEDGSVQWALLDVLVDLPAGGKAEFVVKKGKCAKPPKPLKITEAGGKVTVDSGAAKFVVDTVNFRLLESVDIGGKRLAGPGAVEVVTKDGKKLSAGKPYKVSWEYRGPVRATLRLDGTFGAEFLRYTTRLTFFAGLASVRVDHSLRNSNPQVGDDVRMKSASVSLAVTGDKTGGDGKATLIVGGLLVTQRHTGGCFPGGGRKGARYKTSFEKGAVIAWCVPEGSGGRGVYGYGEGYFALADATHKDTEIWLDFSSGAPDPAISKARRSKLLVLADPIWISETGGLGYGKFGTLADEVATYKKWGWKGADDAGKQAKARRKHDPSAWVGGVLCHNDSESDNAELGLLMYLRTGDRGWFDYGESWARYYKSHATRRTDGFVYDGFRHTRSYGSSLSKRTCKGLKFGWYGPKKYNWNDTRFCMCHSFASGMFDYYCLTGDVDALEGGLDQAEMAAITYGDRKNAPGKALALGRSWGRQMKAVVRAYQATRAANWKKSMEYFMQRHIKAPNRNYDGSGLYLSTYKAALFFSKNLKNMPTTLKDFCKQEGITWKSAKGKLMVSKGGQSWSLTMSPQSFEFAACAEAVARCAEVTGDPEMKKIVVELGRGARDVYWSKTSDNHGLKAAYVGFPRKGKSYDPDEWANGPQKKSGYHARFVTDICSRAYSQSKDKSFLDAAKRVWNRGSKWGYWRTKQGTPDNEVSVFASTRPPNADKVDIRNCSRLFYEAARTK
jgi:PcRGLX-like N-terminal RIFT barrel domain/PcRGLX-like protein central beta sandwich domain